LQTLNLSRAEINDQGIDILIPALKMSDHLQSLKLENNSIASKRLQKLALLLEPPSSNLKSLYIAENNIDDEVVTTFTGALVNNRTLKSLGIRNYHNTSNLSITDEGWEAFSKLLCDTSCVNSTYLSNHTLEYLGPTPRSDVNPLKPLLTQNTRKNKKEVAIIKTLKHHKEFDMMPFFEWEFKALPLVITWFERASMLIQMASYGLGLGDFEPNIGPRKLSSIYQFVRGMPVLYVETCLKKELDDIKAELSLSQMEGEPSEQKQQLERRKMSILERLGSQRSSIS